MRRDPREMAQDVVEIDGLCVVCGDDDDTIAGECLACYMAFKADERGDDGNQV